ncbi:MAG: hypothetical protein JNK67_25410 [Alphaproteobacteria bacterium]|nr:hypothetical protein [Alphaproteobacteria bacterium]
MTRLSSAFLRPRRAAFALVVASLLAAPAALAQGSSLPNVRRLPDGTLEIVKPPPEQAPAQPKAPRKRPAPAAAAAGVEPRDDEGPANEKVMIGRTSFRTVEAAIKAAKPGDTILLPPLIYRRGITIHASGVTLRGVPGTFFVGGAAGGKAAMVVTGNDVTIEQIGCADIYVADKNGACVRAEGVNLTLRNVEFRDSETGILATNRAGQIRIVDSVFEGLGRNGQAHSIYVNGGRLHVSGTRVAGAQVGHEVKSRAAETVIEDCVITSGAAEDSRAVDVPEGGVLIMRRNILHKGSRSQNFDMIGVGLENRRHGEARVVLEDNTLIFDRPNSSLFNLAPWATTPEVRGNLIVGGDGARWPGNRVFATRAAAGMPPAPELPPAGAPR